MRLTPRLAVPAAALLATSGLVAAGLVSGTADAATPAQGTVSVASPSVTWTGGPFVTSNVTGQALDPPSCAAPTSCDDYTVHVDTPAGYESGHSLVVKAGWPNTAADFDLYVLDSQGNTVDSAASNADPEQVVIPATAGDYTVRVVPFAPLGESYTGTATLQDKPADPAPGTDTAPGFTDYAAPSSFGGSNDAGEPSIGTNFKSGATLYQSGLSTFKATFDDSVSPATASWSDVSANATDGCPLGSTTSLDPILFTDHDTGRTFESQLSGVDSLTCWTDDDGATWNPSQGGGIPSGVDHQSIGGGPWASGGIGSLPISSYKNSVYYCSQDIATAFCAVSRDGGTTFGPGIPAYSLLDCGGIHGHVKVAPDGTAYVPNRGCGNSQAVVVSKDNGTSWTVQHVPGATPGDSDPSVGIGKNGTVYFGYVGADGHPGVAVSNDHGATWNHTQNVGSEFGIQNAVFPAMVAGDDDRAAFAYLGTPTGGNYQDSANFKGVWHLYVTTTYDGGKTWQTSDATPNDPVQRGSICTAGTTCGSDRNLLDFMDVTIDDHGRIEAAFADGCITACVTDPSQNGHDAYATIARQSSGKTLFSAFDPALTNLTLSSLNVSKAPTGNLVATMLVKNTGTTAVSGVRTQVLDNRKQVALTSPIGLAAGASKTVTVSWNPTGTKAHSVTSVVDPQNTITESLETDNKLLRTLG